MSNFEELRLRFQNRQLAEEVLARSENQEYLSERLQRLETAVKKFCDYYAGSKAAMLGNGQARKSLDEFNAILAKSCDPALLRLLSMAVVGELGLC